MNQKLVKQITEKSHINQRFENSKQIFNEFKNKKLAKDMRLNEITNSLEQYEVLYKKMNVLNF